MQKFSWHLLLIISTVVDITSSAISVGGSTTFNGDGDIADFRKIESSAELQLRLADSRNDTVFFRPLNGSDNEALHFNTLQKWPFHLERPAGGLLTLNCQPSGYPLPNISWYHNDILLDVSASGDHYKQQEWTLAVSPLTLSDAGVYQCILCNACCCIDRSYRVDVLFDKSTTTTTTTTKTTLVPATTSERLQDHEADAVDKGCLDTLEGKAILPTFKKPNNMNRLQHYPSGSSVTLSCPVNGNPMPNITWTRNGSDVVRHSGAARPKGWQITMNNLITYDSGKYRCTMCNCVGCIFFDFDVRVIERLRHRPIISDKYPQNQTALVNTTVVFECRIVSDTAPVVRWMRIVHRNRSIAHTENERINTTMNLQLINLPTSEDQPHILNMTNVTHAHEGWYTCVATNEMGESKVSAYLRVVDRLPYHDVLVLLRSHPMGITMVAFFILLLFLIGSATIVFMLRRLRREKLLKHRIETVHQWTKKVIIYRPPSLEGVCGGVSDLQVPVIKIEKQRTTFSTTSGNSDPSQAFNEYEFPLDSNWEIPRQQLELGSILGEGAFGRVVMAEAEGLPRSATNNGTPTISGTIVAVKMVKEEHTDADMASLVREMEVMKLIGKHINIINLLGCCTQGGPLWVIVEYAPHGNLKDFLKQNRPGTRQQRSESDGYLDDKLSQVPHLGEKELTMFAFQIARGMEYLASRRNLPKKIIVKQRHLMESFQTTRPSLSASEVAKYQKTYARFTKKEKPSREFVAKRATLA